MNQHASSKYVPGLPSDDGIDTQTNAPVDDSIKIYDGVADCTMNDADTLKSVKSRAKDLAIQKVKQKIADYVYGFWKDRYLPLPDDEVLSIASEIYTITDVKYNVFDSDDNTLVRATVLAQVDDNDVMNYIIQFFKERNELKLQNESLRKEIADLKQQQDKTSHAIENQNNSLRNENSDLKRQIEDLKRQNVSLARENSTLSSQNRELNRQIADLKQQQDKTTRAIENQNKSLRNENSDLKRQIADLKRQRDNSQKNTQQITFPVISNEKIALAEQKADEAMECFRLNRYTAAIMLYDEAIRLNPNFDMAYNNRGLAYKNLRQYDQAIQDFDKALQINPNNASAEYNRGQTKHLQR